jgi:uroporphyrinogen III methyltransferase/synthase
VVRLKAGDPFVFGRGGEEAEELTEAGIPFEIVPGVSAALGAAATAGIPLTHRACASDVTLVSGHDADGSHQSWTSWEHLAAGSGTVVLFMASQQLEANLVRLIAGGRPPETPAAYVANATKADEQVIFGTLRDLVACSSGVDPKAPAVVIVGEVVGRRVRVSSRRGPLAGCRVLVARARPGGSAIAARLRALSADVQEAPRIETAAPENYAALDAVLARLHDFTAVMFDSTDGVRVTLRRMGGCGLGASDLARVRIIAIGNDVRVALICEGVAVAATVAGSCRAALRMHEAVLRPGPILLVTRAGERPSLRKDLEMLDVGVESVPAYRYIHHVPRRLGGRVDLVVLPSSSAAIALLRSKLGCGLRDVPMVAMGPRSEAAARRCGAREVVRAQRDDVTAIVAGVIGALGAA